MKLGGVLFIIFGVIVCIYNFIAGGILLIIGAIMTAAGSKSQQETAQKANLRSCPYCKELIQKAAIKCKHCGATVKSEAPIGKIKTDKGGMWECGNCHVSLYADSIKCYKCGGEKEIVAVREN